MKIRVVPRSFFEEIAGTKAERFLLEEWKVISILSHNGYDSESPFSEAVRRSPNLLTLMFDDVVEPPDPPEPAVRLFTAEQAELILRFAGDGARPVIVHCTGGVSRSGAVGQALDWWFNQEAHENAEDHAYFLRMNRGIRPNPLVLRTMRRVLSENENTVAERR